jgi:hypothetical protein
LEDRNICRDGNVGPPQGKADKSVGQEIAKSPAGPCAQREKIEIAHRALPVMVTASVSPPPARLVRSDCSGLPHHKGRIGRQTAAIRCVRAELITIRAEIIAIRARCAGQRVVVR